MVGASLTQVEAVQAMFPHIPEASIRYDLQRSGSAEATCERILQDGYLPIVRLIANLASSPLPRCRRAASSC